MKVTLDLNKSIEENASIYFEKAKKARQKSERAAEALARTQASLENLSKEQLEKEEKPVKMKRKPEWYEKFRWFFTSDGSLVIGGRDATTNEMVIKKYTEKDDTVFHSQLPGSPFVVLKGPRSEQSLEETAQFTACYSKAWKAGRTVADVFCVDPEQVTKEAPSGEYVGKGSFMIYGKKEFFSPVLKLFIGRMDDGKIMAGPESAVKKHCKKYVQIYQGKEKTSSVAKKVKQEIGAEDLDELIRIIPPGSKHG